MQNYNDFCIFNYTFSRNFLAISTKSGIFAQNFAFMSTVIEDFTLQKAGDWLAREWAGPNIVKPHIALIRQSGTIKDKAQQLKPYRVGERRIVCALQGAATYRVNLLQYIIHAGEVAVVPAQSIVSMERADDDFAAEVLAVSEQLDGFTAKPIEDVVVLTPKEQDRERIALYIHLIAQQLSRPSTPEAVVGHLATSLWMDLGELCRRTTAKQEATHLSRGEELFKRFIALVTTHGTKEHTIAFYADRLCVTPNHLSAVIRQQSGQTVQDWINRRILQEAQVLLLHTDMTVYAIAEQLHFSDVTVFNRYIKKHLGLSPRAYREKV